MATKKQQETYAIYPDGALIRNRIVGHPRHNWTGTIVRRLPYTFIAPGYDINYDGVIVAESSLNLELVESLRVFIDGVWMRAQLQRRSCNVRTCSRCNGSGPKTGHGPYWYAYASANGKRITKYIGAVLPSTEQAQE
jgi:hypothetical protein